MALKNVTRGTVLADRERWAVSAADRARGLLDKPRLDPGEALVISPCNSVHMFGMAYALDVVFVAADGTVVRAIEGLAPMRFTRIHLRARRTIELPVGTVAATGTRAGDQLDLGVVPEEGTSHPLLLWTVLLVAMAAAIYLLMSIT